MLHATYLTLMFTLLLLNECKIRSLSKVETMARSSGGQHHRARREARYVHSIVRAKCLLEIGFLLKVSN